MSSQPMETKDIHYDRYIQVVFLPTGVDRKPPPPVRSILIDPTSTFDKIIKELREGDSDRWTVLQAHYGHEPGWTPCEPTALIEAMCQILYAVDNTPGLDYVLALIRTSSFDYPLAIYESLSTRTVKQVVVTAYPSLTEDITSITEYGSRNDISDTSFLLIKRDKTHKQSPMAFTVTVGEPPARFQMNVDVESILPFLQIPFVNCQDLVQRSFDLPCHSLQMIYASSALSHAIFSLSSEITVSAVTGVRCDTIGKDGKMQESGSVIDDEGPSDSLIEDLVKDRLRVGHLLAEELEKTLDSLDELLAAIGDNAASNFIQPKLDDIYLKLCGEYPKAVTIRRAYPHFCVLKDLDEEQMEGSMATKEAGDSHMNNKEEPAHIIENVYQQETSTTPVDVDADAFATDSSPSDHRALVTVTRRRNFFHPMASPLTGDIPSLHASAEPQQAPIPFEMDGPIKLADGTLRCRAHHMEICDVCRVDYSFMRDILQEDAGDVEDSDSGRYPSADEEARMQSSKWDRCAVCRKPAKKTCRRCKSVYYCGLQHQVEDRKVHEQRCKKASDAPPHSTTSHTVPPSSQSNNTALAALNQVSPDLTAMSRSTPLPGLGPAFDSPITPNSRVQTMPENLERFSELYLLLNALQSTLLRSDGTGNASTALGQDPLRRELEITRRGDDTAASRVIPERPADNTEDGSPLASHNINFSHATSRLTLNSMSSTSHTVNQTLQVENVASSSGTAGRGMTQRFGGAKINTNTGLWGGGHVGSGNHGIHHQDYDNADIITGGGTVGSDNQQDGHSQKP